jgi:glutamate dehydrogenase (NADP+)
LLKNPNEPEFLQAVLEVAETVIPLSKKIKISEQNALERMVESDRIIMFRVALIDDKTQVDSVSK